MAVPGMLEGHLTGNFIVDRLQQWWREARLRFPRVKTLMINLDEGPETHSRRSQFLKRVVAFARKYGLMVRLAYYPPYLSKYSPIERCWGILEMHRDRSLLDSAQAVLGDARSMTCRRKHPMVNVVETACATGVRLAPEEMVAALPHCNSEDFRVTQAPVPECRSPAGNASRYRLCLSD